MHLSQQMYFWFVSIWVESIILDDVKYEFLMFGILALVLFTATHSHILRSVPKPHWDNPEKLLETSTSGISTWFFALGFSTELQWDVDILPEFAFQANKRRSTSVGLNWSSNQFTLRHFVMGYLLTPSDCGKTIWLIRVKYLLHYSAFCPTTPIFRMKITVGTPQSSLVQL